VHVGIGRMAAGKFQCARELFAGLDFQFGTHGREPKLNAIRACW
jgi:hypothetical protein